MTKLIENEMKELFKEDLGNNPINFWRDLFNLVDYYAEIYFERLEKQGVDLNYLEYKIGRNISPTSIKGETVKETLSTLTSSIEKIMSELNYTYHEENKKHGSIEKLEKKIQQKEVEIQKLQNEKENLEAIYKATEAEIINIKDQTLYDLEEEIKDIRTFLTRLPEDIKSLEENGETLPDKFKKRIHRGIQDAYTILQEAKLWQYDTKPLEVKFNKEERRTRRNQNKKDEEKNIELQKHTQLEQNQNEKEVTLKTTDRDNSVIENNAEQQKNITETINFIDEKSSHEINEETKVEKNSKKEIFAQVEPSTEEKNALIEDDVVFQDAKFVKVKEQVEVSETEERQN